MLPDLHNDNDVFVTRRRYLLLVVSCEQTGIYMRLAVCCVFLKVGLLGSKLGIGKRNVV